MKKGNGPGREASGSLMKSLNDALKANKKNMCKIEKQHVVSKNKRNKQR